MDSISLWQSLVSKALDASKAVNPEIALQLKQVALTLSPYIPIPVTEAELSQSNWVEGLDTKPIKLNGFTGTLKHILPLYDGSFLAVANDAPAIHYNSSFGLIRKIPFNYLAPSGNPQNYLAPDNASVTTFQYQDADEMKNMSLVLITMAASSIVNIYSYRDAKWEFLTTIGTVGSPGTTAGLLSIPKCAAGYFDVNTNILTVAVGCHGANTASGVSFIKKFSVGMDGLINDEGIISYPDQFLVAVTGSLIDSETDQISYMQFKNSGVLGVVSEITDEMGFINISSVPFTEAMTKGDLKELEYNDNISNPVVFFQNEGYMVVGDEFGHITLLSQDLSRVISYFGKPKNSSSTTEYPNEFDRIDDVKVVGNTLYIVSGGKLFSSNFLSLSDQEAVYIINPLFHDVKLESVYGFNSAKIEVSFDAGLTYKPLEYFATTKLPGSTALMIKISRPLEQVLKNKEPLYPGLLLVSI